MKIPKAKPVSRDKVIEMYKEELRRKDVLIKKLEEENKLLLSLSLKNAKQRLEEKKEKND